MRTALSIPDHLYEAAEREAERTGKSRSQLYADALAEYLLRHAPDKITEAMNLALEALGEHDLTFTRAAARHTLERIEW